MTFSGEICGDVLYVAISCGFPVALKGWAPLISDIFLEATFGCVGPAPERAGEGTRDLVIFGGREKAKKIDNGYTPEI